MEQQIEEYLAKDGHKFSDDASKKHVVDLFKRIKTSNPWLDFNGIIGYIHIGGYVVPLTKDKVR